MGFGGFLGRIEADVTTASSLAHDTVSAVADTTVTTIVTYVASGTKYLTKISCSGTDYAKFFLVVNTTTIEIRRSGPDRNAIFDFDGALKLSDGDIVDVKVEHFVTGQTADFEATIYGV